MEFCSRCQGGAIDAPNCPVCGGSGWIEEASSAEPAASIPPAPPLGRPSARPRQGKELSRNASSVGTQFALTQEQQQAQEAARKKRAQKRRERRARERDEQRRKAAEEKRIQHLQEVKRRIEQKLDRDRKEREVLAKDLRPAGTEGTIVGDPPLKRRLRKESKPTANKPGKPGKDKPGRVPSPRLSREERSAQLAQNSQLKDQLSALLRSPEARDLITSPGKDKVGKRQHQKRRPQKKRAKAETRLRELSPKDPLQAYRREFTTSAPGIEAEEDGGRDLGHSFRDRGGQFGSMPLYDDHEE